MNPVTLIQNIIEGLLRKGYVKSNMTLYIGPSIKRMLEDRFLYNGGYPDVVPQQVYGVNVVVEEDKTQNMYDAFSIFQVIDGKQIKPLAIYLSIKGVL